MLSIRLNCYRFERRKQVATKLRFGVPKNQNLAILLNMQSRSLLRRSGVAASSSLFETFFTSQNVLKRSIKKSHIFVPFGANIAIFGPNSWHPCRITWLSTSFPFLSSVQSCSFDVLVDLGSSSMKRGDYSHFIIKTVCFRFSLPRLQCAACMEVILLFLITTKTRFLFRPRGLLVSSSYGTNRYI